MPNVRLRLPPTLRRPLASNVRGPNRGVYMCGTINLEMVYLQTA